MAQDLIKSYIDAGENNETAFRALALSRLNMTINEIVVEILNHPKSDVPRWVEGEKGAGKKVGTAKSLKTIRTNNPSDWRKFRFAHFAQCFEGDAGNYIQTDKKKFAKKNVGKDASGKAIYDLRYKKYVAKTPKKKDDSSTGENNADSTRAIPVGTFAKDLQVFIDTIRPEMTEGIRTALLELTAKHDMEVNIEAI